MFSPLSLIPTPYLLIGCAVAAAVVVGGAYTKGHSDGVDKVRVQWNADKLAQAETTRLREAAMRKTANIAATAHEADRVVIRTKFVPIQTEVERVVNQIEYRDRACLDDAGVRVLQASVNAANGGDTAEPGSPVPAAAASR